MSKKKKKDDYSKYVAYDRIIERGFFSPLDSHPGALTIKKAIFNDPATIIYWSDGTKTIVKRKSDEPYDIEKAFAMAHMKKAYGNDYRFHRAFKKWVPQEQPVVMPDLNVLLESLKVNNPFAEALRMATEILSNASSNMTQQEMEATDEKQGN